MTLEQREQYQLRSIRHANGVLAYWHHHRALASTTPATVRWHRAQLHWLGRELRQTRSAIAAVRARAEAARRATAARAVFSSFPPHHALWLCIHRGEGAWSDPNSGGNGHYGGLQMHPGWGYGTSYYANNDSQYTQEWAAERGYAASGYSSTWLNGQWGQTISPCWQYAG